MLYGVGCREVLDEIDKRRILIPLQGIKRFNPVYGLSFYWLRFTVSVFIIDRFLSLTSKHSWPAVSSHGCTVHGLVTLASSDSKVTSGTSNPCTHFGRAPLMGDRPIARTSQHSKSRSHVDVTRGIRTHDPRVREVQDRVAIWLAASLDVESYIFHMFSAVTSRRKRDLRFSRRCFKSRSSGLWRRMLLL